jgi:hypothetical protein
MRIAPIIAASVVAVGLSMAVSPSQAAPAAPQVPLLQHIQSSQTLVQDVGWRRRHWNRCRHWRNTCARRWGWGTWRFRRCVVRHAC